MEIDRATGRVRIDRYVTAHDAGTLLNPALADMARSAAPSPRGLGAALMEEFRYGPDGSFQSGTLADYLMPTTCEVRPRREAVIVHLETARPPSRRSAPGAWARATTPEARPPASPTRWRTRSACRTSACR
ncbi:molybdopterin cofactor-binding domain-containing protein [Cupriavidus basilensis]